MNSDYLGGDSLPRRRALRFVLGSLLLMLGIELAGAQELHGYTWMLNKKVTREAASGRTPELIAPPDLPGRQRVVALASRPSNMTVEELGGRRYLATQLAYGSKADTARATLVLQVEAMYDYLPEVSTFGATRPDDEDVAAYDAVADATLARYGESFGGAAITPQRYTTMLELRQRIAELDAAHLQRHTSRKHAATRVEALLVLGRRAGMSVRAAFGLLVAAPPKLVYGRAFWLEAYLPGEGWLPVTLPLSQRGNVMSRETKQVLPDLIGGSPPEALHLHAMVPFGFIGSGDVGQRGLSALPIYSALEAEQWHEAKVLIGMNDVASSLLDVLYSKYRTADSTFLVEVEEALQLAPGDVRLHVFRATALSRLGRRSEAEPAFHVLLQRRAQLTESDRAHLYWAFAKHVAWGGDIALGESYVAAADQVAEDGGYVDQMKTDPDWVEIRKGVSAAGAAGAGPE